MDINQISGMVSTKLASTQALTNQLVADAKTFIAEMQTASMSQYIPGINVVTDADYTPAEQASEAVPPEITPPDPTSDAAEMPEAPPELIVRDYDASDPIDPDVSDFQDPPEPSGDIVISSGEDGGAAAYAIANMFIDAVRAQITNAAFDAGYVQDVRAGLADRLGYSTDIINRTASRLASMGLASPQAEMQTLRDYDADDNRRIMDNKHREATAENDKNMVEVAIRLAQILYAHANAVYARALDVAKSLIEYGNAVYQLQIAIERAGTGVARTAMQTDFESVEALSTINRLNLQARKSNMGIYSDVSTLAIKSLENFNGKYEAQISRYGASVDKARTLGSFELSKSSLSEKVLSERVQIALQNASASLSAFITTMRAKSNASKVGESMYSQALNGAIEARNTLVSIGKKDNTSKIG